jgi:NADPH:quinone reductase-like Zn-dependent oxidoreductase
MMRSGDTFLSRIILGFANPKGKYKILGTEFSGKIESIGPKVTLFKTGDKVYGFRGFGTGTYAEFKCMPENGSLAKMPSNLTFSEAASLVDSASTALFFLKNKANIKQGQKVLINGASGGMGVFAVQIAKYFDAEVTGVCSTKNIELVKSIGADKVIDYSKDDFAKNENTYDIIFDTVSKSSFSGCKKALKPKGKYLVTKLSLLRIFQTLWTKIQGNKRTIFAMSVNKTKALKIIKNLVEEGKLKPVIDKAYAFEQIAEAHQYVDKGHKKGNVVIAFDESEP